jgi:hypothetical protein
LIGLFSPLLTETIAGERAVSPKEIFYIETSGLSGIMKFRYQSYASFTIITISCFSRQAYSAKEYKFAGRNKKFCPTLSG